MKQATNKNHNILRIAVLGTSKCLDYLPVEAAFVKVGMRAEVTVRKKVYVGIVVQLLDKSAVPAEKLVRVKRYIDAEPVVDKRFMQLIEWVAQYYHCPIGTVLQVALPRFFRMGKPIKENTQRVWSVQGDADTEAISKRATQQLAMMELLRQGEVSEDILREKFPSWRATIKALSQKDWVKCEERKVQSKPMLATGQIHPLNKMQTKVVQSILREKSSFKCSLLEGVTGSGKTEVYLSLSRETLAQGGQVMILLPEVSLTPQNIKRFSECLGATVVASHSHLSDGQRYAAWQAMLCGTASVIIGTRSAMFTPCKNLQLIVVDEEHDLSYKQQDTLLYHARDVAIKRAQLLKIPVLLGSATPSLESLHNAWEGKYSHYQLPHRIGNAQMPTCDILDVRQEKLKSGLSKTLIEMVQHCLKQGEQVLLFLNRRGYAPRFMCKSCRAFVECPDCELTLTYHLSKNTLLCHHCGYGTTCVHVCQKCGQHDFIKVGYGTERIEEEIEKVFPNTEVVRIDADTTRRKGELEERLSRIREGSAQILIGTQLLSKGHHFPKVTLVGLLNVDQGLFAFDFRALERMSQLIVQVSGRAGREHLPGKVVLQTCHPDHPELYVLLQKGYAVLAQDMLEQRKSVDLPPHTFLALFRVESKRREDGKQFLHKVASKIRYYKKQGVRVFDPVPSPLEKRAGLYRMHLMLVASRRAVLQKCLADAMPKIRTLSQAKTLSWHLDVDPMIID